MYCNRRSESSAMKSLTVALFLLVTCLNASFGRAAYVVEVPAKDEECFLITAAKTAGTIYGNYELLSDASTAAPVSVVIMDAKTNRIFYRSRRGALDGSFKVTLNAKQRVNLCVQNGIFSSGRRKLPQTKPHDNLPRTVGLSFTYEPVNEVNDLHNQNERIIQAAMDLKGQVSRLKDHLGYMRVRESMHRETVEATFSRLMGWNLLQGGGLILVAFCQIMYVRRFLEQRRYM